MSLGHTETVISRSNIVDQIAALLYATKVVPADTEITNIQFGELFGASETELVPLKIFTKGREKEVQVIKYNGKKS